MPDIKYQHGTRVVSPTLSEQFSEAIPALLKNFLLAKQQGDARTIKLQDMMEDIRKQRQQFEALDPELQDELKRAHPAEITSLYDDSRFIKLSGGKVPVDYSPKVPATRKRTSAETADLEKRLAESRKTVAEASKTESDTKLAQKVNDVRLGQLANPQSDVDRFIGMFGKAPTMDELQAFTMTDEENKKNFRQRMVGTLEYKTKQRDDLLDALQKQYQPKDKKEMDQMRQAADYMSGLSTDMPVKLPESLDQHRQRIEEMAQRNRAMELGTSKERIAYERGAKHLELVQQLTANGMDPRAANTAVGDLLAGKDVDLSGIPKDKKKELDLKIDQSRLDLLKLELDQKAIENPKVKVMVDALRLQIENAPTSSRPLDIGEKIKDIYKAAGIAVPEAVMKKSNWETIKGWFTPGSKAAAIPSGQPRTSVKEKDQSGNYGPGSPSQNVDQRTEKSSISPEIKAQVQKHVDLMKQKASDPNLTDQDAVALSATITQLMDAVDKNDEAAVRKVLLGIK